MIELLIQDCELSLDNVDTLMYCEDTNGVDKIIDSIIENIRVIVSYTHKLSDDIAFKHCMSVIERHLVFYDDEDYNERNIENLQLIFDALVEVLVDNKLILEDHLN